MSKQPFFKLPQSKNISSWNYCCSLETGALLPISDGCPLLELRRKVCISISIKIKSRLWLLMWEAKGKRTALVSWLTYPYSELYKKMPGFTNSCKIPSPAKGLPSSFTLCNYIFQFGGRFNLRVRLCRPSTLHCNYVQRTLSSSLLGLLKGKDWRLDQNQVNLEVVETGSLNVIWVPSLFPRLAFRGHGHRNSAKLRTMPGFGCISPPGFCELAAW